VSDSSSADAARAIVAVGFGKVLRRCAVQVSPVEVIEAQRVLGMLGTGDVGALRAGLRSVTTKYAHERAGFEQAFEEFFLGRTAAATGGEPAGPTGDAAELPGGELDLVDDDPMAGYTDHNPRSDELGDLLDAPDAGSDFNPHRDDDDFSLSIADRDLSVRSGSDSGKRGITYTLSVERAGAMRGKELTSQAGIAQGNLNWDDPAGVLAWLDAVDPRSVYGADDGRTGDELSAAQLSSLVEAVESFVAELATRLGDLPEEPRTERDETGVERAGYRMAAAEFLRRIRGAPTARPRRHGRGKLDVRRTVRESLRTDGVPFRMLVRRKVPSKVRLLVVADLSLSVRSVTAFVLRLAQMLHRMAHRCSVLAFVDTPVDVTRSLLRSTGDDALTAALGTPGLDLDASSDYGRTLADLLSNHAGLLDAKTTVLFVGDARGNGRPPGTEHLRELRKRVYRIGWITPEPRRYWAQAGCAMHEFAEICDSVVTARDVDDLSERVVELANRL
jgi:uncharacterized protein with von Willebrand factor type A (vWA) domain